jgi:hypothetical protein
MINQPSIKRDLTNLMRPFIDFYNKIKAKVIKLWPDPPLYSHPALPEKVKKSFFLLQRQLHQPPKEQMPAL